MMFQVNCARAAKTTQYQRHLSTSIPRRNAQPIDLSSSIKSPSNAENPTLSQDALSRATAVSSLPQTISSLKANKQNSKSSSSSISQADPTVYVGRISRTSTMPKTVQITRQQQLLDKTLKKHYTRPLRLLAHDPNPANFLREGDVVEYSRWTAAEESTKRQKLQDRLDRQLQQALEDDKKSMAGYVKKHGEYDPTRGPTVRKLLRARDREAKDAQKDKKRRTKRGVMFVVRRVVTPFATPLEERLNEVNLAQKVPRSASQGGTGTDSLLKGKRGNVSKQHARAATAG